MKQILQYSIAVLLILITFGSFAQSNNLPGCIKETNFYVRPVHSGGAKDETAYSDGSTQSNQRNPTYQYFLYLQASCKKLTINSVEIDNVKYTFQVKSVTAPITIEEGQLSGKKLELVKKGKYHVFQLDNLSHGGRQKSDRKVSHSVLVKGTLNGKAFTIRSVATEVDPLVAQ